MDDREARRFDRQREKVLTVGPPGFRAEFEAIEDTFELVRASGPLPRVPLTVLTAGEFRSPLRKEAGESFARLFQPLWLTHQRMLAGLVPGGKHLIVEGAGHYIHEDRPDVVVEEIVRVLREARSR